MNLSDAAIRHRTTVFVLMIVIAFMGVTAYVRLPRESAPDIKIPIMNVITIYPGVAPGIVLRQSPPAGHRIDPRTPLSLDVSRAAS